MVRFNNSFPWLMACVAAFIITFLVRLILPSTENIQYSGNNIKMPDVPFVEKDSKKNKDCYVLVALKDIKQFEKITSQTVTWKKWPREGISASFIAKDSDGNMLNTNYTYSNVINLFSKFPIVKGTPVTMTMLSRKRQETDEAKKLAAVKRTLRKKIEKEVTQKMTRAFEQKLKDETDAIKKNEIIVKRDKVKSGMGIVTVPIDQRSMASSGFLNIGDRVDLLYPAKGGNSQDFTKFKNVKILEIDGTHDPSVLSKLKNPVPKNITIEIETANLESLVKQITDGRQAIILVKNQHDVIREEIARNPVKELIEERTKNKYINEFMKKVITDEDKKTNNAPATTKKENKFLKFAINTFNTDAASKADEDSSKRQKLLEIAKNAIQSEPPSSSEDNKKLLKTMSSAFEADALVNEGTRKGKQGGIIAVTKGNVTKTAKYGSDGKILMDDEEGGATTTSAPAAGQSAEDNPTGPDIQVSKGGTK